MAQEADLAGQQEAFQLAVRDALGRMLRQRVARSETSEIGDLMRLAVDGIDTFSIAVLSSADRPGQSGNDAATPPEFPPMLSENHD